MEIGGYDYQVLVYDPSSALSVLRDSLHEKWPNFVEEVEVEENSTWHYFYSDEVSWGMIKELGVVPEGEDEFFTVLVNPIAGEDTSWLCVTTGSGLISEYILKALTPFRAFWEVRITPNENNIHRTRHILQEYIGRENPPWSVIVSNPNHRDELLHRLTAHAVDVEVLFSGELIPGLSGVKSDV